MDRPEASPGAPMPTGTLGLQGQRQNPGIGEPRGKGGPRQRGVPKEAIKMLPLGQKTGRRPERPVWLHLKLSEGIIQGLADRRAPQRSGAQAGGGDVKDTTRRATRVDFLGMSKGSEREGGERERGRSGRIAAYESGWRVAVERPREGGPAPPPLALILPPQKCTGNRTGLQIGTAPELVKDHFSGLNEFKALEPDKPCAQVLKALAGVFSEPLASQ